jgi:uncharacterized protein (TIGR02594 family)
MPVLNVELQERLPARYGYLALEPGPRLLLNALALYGVKEVAGAGDNPVITDWARELVDGGHAPAWLTEVYTEDAVPWCGLFIGVCAARADLPVPPELLRARAWAEWARPAPAPVMGDVLVFWRGSPDSASGHVGIYVGEDARAYHVLGGNQGDAVSIVRIDKGRLLPEGGIRRTPGRELGNGWARPVFLDAASAHLSENEA